MRLGRDDLHQMGDQSHRESRECRSDRTGTDLLGGEGQTLCHEPQIASLRGAVKFLSR